MIFPNMAFYDNFISKTLDFCAHEREPHANAFHDALSGCIVFLFKNRFLYVQPPKKNSGLLSGPLHLCLYKG